ncbi:MAG: hypothetical protein WDN04_13625 [Rhodospirillales bacterium]
MDVNTNPSAACRPVRDFVRPILASPALVEQFQARVREVIGNALQAQFARVVPPNTIELRHPDGTLACVIENVEAIHAR